VFPFYPVVLGASAQLVNDIRMRWQFLMRRVSVAQCRDPSSP
jgi:hypothetical protein